MASGPSFLFSGWGPPGFRNPGGPESGYISDNGTGLGMSRHLELRLGLISRDVGPRPVGDLLLGILDELAPGLGADETLRAPHFLELAVGEDLADDDRLLQVVVLLVHLHPAARGQEVLARDGLADGVHVGGARLLARLPPDVDPDIGGLHRIVGDALRAAGQAVLLAVRLERLHERLVLGRVDRLEVVPRGQVADQRRRVHAAELVLGDRERDDRALLRRQALVGELFVERHVRVAVDRGDDGRAAARGERLDLADDRLVILVAERRVLLLDARLGDAVGDQLLAEDLVRRAGIDVVRAQQVELLLAAAFLREQVVDRGAGLLVDGRARVEHAARALLALILHRVEQDAVLLLEDRQHRLAAHRRPAAEDDADLVLHQQLLRLLGEERPVRRRIDDDRLDLAAEDASSASATAAPNPFSNFMILPPK